jgi:hypothetical protein
MADAVVAFQEWQSFRAGTGWAGLIQEQDRWIDTTRYSSAVVEAECPLISNCTLLIEGCDVQGGSFTTHTALTASTAGAIQLYLQRSAPYGSSDRLSSLIRWRIEGNAGAEWNVMFRLNLVLKS